MRIIEYIYQNTLFEHEKFMKKLFNKQNTFQSKDIFNIIS